MRDKVLASCQKRNLSNVNNHGFFEKHAKPDPDSDESTSGQHVTQQDLFKLRCLIQGFMESVLGKLEIILMNQQQVTEQLNTLNAAVAEIGTGIDKVKDCIVKVGTETDALNQKIIDLQTAINNGGDVSPEVEAALAAVTSGVGTLRDKVGVAQIAVNDVDSKVPDTAPVQPS